MADDAHDVDLSLVSTDALVRELVSRYDHIIIVRERFPTEDCGECLYDYHGGLSGAIGLAERAKHSFLRRLHDEGPGDA